MDIGANCGHVSISALKAFPEAKIICFEPVKETFDKLKELLMGYVPERAIYCQQIAISDFNGTADMNITNYSPANSLNATNSTYSHYNPEILPVKKETVQVSTLDNLLDKMPKKVDIVKIDVEGQEYEVLNGGTIFFKDRVDIIIIEISFQREQKGSSPTFLKVYNLLDAWGYELINMYDLDNRTYDDPNIIDNKMVVQVDCVFRKRR
jgi:FkbM family methyltransferase